jgi:hypothetical protein
MFPYNDSFSVSRFPMCCGFPTLRVLSADPTPSTVCLFPCFVRLVKQLLLLSTAKGLPRSRAIQSGYMPSVETPEGLTANHQTSAVRAAFLGLTTQSAPSFERVIGATFLFTFVMACPTSVYASHFLFGVDPPSAKCTTLEFLTAG